MRPKDYRAWLAATGHSSFEDALNSPPASVNGHEVVESTVTVMGMTYKTGIARAVLEALVGGDVDAVERECEAFRSSFGHEVMADGTYTRPG